MIPTKSMPMAFAGGIAPAEEKGIVPGGVNGDLVTEQFWQSLGYSSGNYTGRSVTADGMFQVTAVWSAIRLISESIAALPLHLFERRDPAAGGDVKAVNHPLYHKLNRQPHRLLTRPVFLEGLAVSLCLWSQAYIRVNYLNGIGSRVASLQPIPKPWVQPYFPDHQRAALNNDVRWRVRNGTGTDELELGEIIPIRGFGHCADLEGLSVAGTHGNAIGLAMAAEEYGSRFFGNGARPGGMFTFDKVLNADQRERLREELQNRYGGAENAHKILIGEMGMNYHKIQSSNNESQFIETRKNQILEIARIFRVPPHKLFEMDKATYNNVEQENRAFLIDTLHPYLDRIETALNSYLLQGQEQDRYFFKFNVEGRLRADLKTRMDSYKTAVLTGIMTPNEARALENLAPKNGGDELLLPLNMAPATLHAEVLQKDGASSRSLAPGDSSDDD